MTLKKKSWLELSLIAEQLQIPLPFTKKELVRSIREVRGKRDNLFKKTSQELCKIAANLGIDAKDLPTKKSLIRAIRSARRDLPPDKFGQAAGTLSDKNQKRISC